MGYGRCQQPTVQYLGSSEGKKHKVKSKKQKNFADFKIK
jgi:hypothetical protein